MSFGAAALLITAGGVATGAVVGALSDPKTRTQLSRVAASTARTARQSARTGALQARSTARRARSHARRAATALRTRTGLPTPTQVRRNSAGRSPQADSGALAGARGFVPALEGLRATAALGVLTTHVAFVTKRSTGTPWYRLLGRLDLAVAVFFALSGFLVWRTHAARARSKDPQAHPRTSARRYLRSRFIRILPAYAVVVFAAMLLLPQNHVNGVVPWVSNLTLTQIYLPNFLVAGLTHAWSLAVEMAFYVSLPLLWTAMSGLRGTLSRWRIPVLAGFAGSGLVFPLVPWHQLGLPAGINEQVLPPAFASWFAAGMILAELATAKPGRIAAACRHPQSRWVWWSGAAAALAATTNPRWFSEGFTHPSSREFATRSGLAASMAFLVLAPVTLAPIGSRFPVLGSQPAQTLGRWTYGIFLWHLLLIDLCMRALRVPLWSGRMTLLWPVTTASSIAVAAASYRWIETPTRRALEQRWR